VTSIPFDAGWSEAYAALAGAGGSLPERIGRIASEHRGGFTVMIEGGEALAQAPASLRRKLEAIGEDKPAVGDWVGYEPVPDGSLVLRSVLPRKTRLRRRRPGSDRAQVLVANVDRVLVITSIGRDLNARRLERYLSVILDGGAEPVVVLSKADLATDREASLALVAAAGGRGALFVSAHTGEGLDAIGALAPSGVTVAMLGSSGVGKSSLANALIGVASDQAVAPLTDEGKGRHTTTRRELLRLPSGGVLIDTPGMRELGLWAAEAGLHEAFSDVEAARARCRFADCRHETEPGCGVRAAVDSGAISKERLGSYLKLASELAGQADAIATAADKRQEARTAQRAMRSRLRDKGRR
jgi:ribosome biogenesis GTPase